VFIHNAKTSLKTATKLLKKHSPNKAKKNQSFFEIWRLLNSKNWKFHDRIFSFWFDLSHFGVIWGKKKKRWKPHNKIMFILEFSGDQ
jgi:hypothetical protein